MPLKIGQWRKVPLEIESSKQSANPVHETTDLITIGLRVEGNRQNSYAFEDRPVEEGAFGSFSFLTLSDGMEDARTRCSYRSVCIIEATIGQHCA